MIEQEICFDKIQCLLNRSLQKGIKNKTKGVPLIRPFTNIKFVRILISD